LPLRWRLAGREDSLAGAALVVWVAVLFREALLGRGVFFERDIHGYWHPLIACFRRMVEGGSWPWWNPEVGFGGPFFADPALQLAYPPTWAALWLPPAAYYTAFAALHCLGTAWGAYRLGRAWSLTPLPALLAAAAWCSSGPFLSGLSLFHHYAGAAWIPWVLWALEGALAAPGRRSATIVGLAVAGQLLAGSADMFIFTALAGAGRILCFAVGGGLRRAGVGRLLGGLGWGALLAFLLSAVQWIPAAALVRSAPRSSHTLRTTTYWSLHPASLGDLVVPYLVSGFPWAEGPRRLLFEGREPFLPCLYVGVGVAVLGALSLLAPGATRPRLLGALMALFLLAALGRFTPFRYLFVLPPVSLLRYPVKYMVPAGLCGALLAGFGLQAWLADWSASLRRRVALLMVGLGAFILLCAGAAAWLGRAPRSLAALVEQRGLEGGMAMAMAAATPRLVRTAEVGLACLLLLWLRRQRASSPPWLTVMLVAVVAADPASVGRHVNALAPAALLARRPAAVEGLSPGDRIFSDPHVLEGLESQPIHLPAGWEPSWGRALGFRERLAPPTGALWQLRGSYDGDFTGLTPDYVAYLSTSVAEYPDSPIGIKLLRMGAVRAVVTMKEIRGLGVPTRYPSVFARPVLRYQVPDPLPTAYWVGQARVVPDPVSYAVLSEPAFDPGREILLAPPGDGDEASGSSGRVSPLESRADHLAFATVADGPGFLVVVAGFAPGWRATVDGRPAPVRRANVLFRAVAVPGGEHRVELRYRPASIPWGLGLSGLGILAALLSGTARWSTERGALRRGSPAASIVTERRGM
jgi:hypothetical protein